MPIMRPLKTTGRVVLGPRVVDAQYARLIAMVDGSGLIQIYNQSSGQWCTAGEQCDFAALWRAPAAPLTFAEGAA
jgi:hypothetical protein